MIWVATKTPPFVSPSLPFPGYLFASHDLCMEAQGWITYLEMLTHVCVLRRPVAGGQTLRKKAGSPDPEYWHHHPPYFLIHKMHYSWRRLKLITQDGATDFNYKTQEKRWHLAVIPQKSINFIWFVEGKHILDTLWRWEGRLRQGLCLLAVEPLSSVLWMTVGEISLTLTLAKINRYARSPLIYPDKESDLEPSVVSHAVSCCLVGWLASWLISWLVDWLIDWLAIWLIGWLVGW